MFDPAIVLPHLPTLIEGAGITFAVSILAILLGLPCGLALCFLRQSARRPVGRAAALYISFFRGTPLLVQLLLFFYVPPAYGVELPAYVTAVAVLTMNTTAFQAEIFRGGLQTIPPGQVEAARMLGFSWGQVRRRILVPQMLRVTLPALTNEAIDILKNSSLVSVIAVSELLRRGRQVAAATYHPLEAYAATGLIYLLLVCVVAYAGRRASCLVGVAR
ncbi:amino acid ABC transporter permease [Azospirillum sp. ST 5-10]|uniref:amino acid ABC transporter permease n=1 Tax=unclassified Azospirillum TaxID=2630922 RepID=UPI003F49E0CB